MTPEQSGYLRSLLDSAIRSALFMAIMRLPLWLQLSIVAVGTAIMMWCMQ